MSPVFLFAYLLFIIYLLTFFVSKILPEKILKGNQVKESFPLHCWTERKYFKISKYELFYKSYYLFKILGSF